MATPANEKQFAKAMKALQTRWPNLSKQERDEALAQLANQQLSKSGVPAIGVAENRDLHASTLGQMNFQTWTLDLNPTVVDSPNLSDAQTQQLGDTLFHESRHGEQWYLIARNEAGTGKSARDISQATGMPPGVATAASNHPLARNDVAYSCSQQVYDSIYGKGAAARNKTLTDLPKVSDALKDADTDNKAIQANADSTPEQEAASQAKVAKAYREYMDVYNAYRTLPEERDAWQAGTTISNLLGH